MPKRRTEGIGIESKSESIRNLGSTGSTKEGTRETDKKSKYHLGKTQRDDLSQDCDNGIEWMPFKLELEDKDRKKRKKRKGRKL